MAIFDYKGYDNLGKNVKGTLEADSEKSARESLKKKGVFPTNLHESGGKKSKKSRSGKKSFLSAEVNFGKMFQSISVADISIMTRQLATLLSAGVPMVDSLVALIEQVENQKLKGIMSEVKADVNEGSSLAKAMGKHSCFSNIYVNMVKAGESSGALEVVLARLADFAEGQAELKNKVMSAMLYPAVMILVGAGIMVIMFTSVIPKITQVFKHSKTELPLQTKILIGTSEFMQNYWWLIILFFIVFWFLFRRWKSKPSGRYRWDSFKLKLPILGPILRMVAVARMTRTLSTLLSSGVGLLPSLDIVRNILSNAVLEKTIDVVRDSVREGESISTPLKRSGEFPPMVTHMVAIGEQTGELEPMLGRIANTYETQVQTKIGMLTSILEPVMILAMGGSVAMIVFAILTPIMQMSQVVK